MQNTDRQDVYTRITDQIVSHLEKGVRPWVRPWNAEHAAGRITRPLRHVNSAGGLPVVGQRHGAELYCDSFFHRTPCISIASA